jgi:hypothetical protein
MRGLKIFEAQPFKDKLTIDVTDYLDGIYFVKVKIEGINYLRKFSKN